MSHGPLIRRPEIVRTTTPAEFSTIRHPACSPAEVPAFGPLVGRLPTTTVPFRNIARTVVRPTPPGQRWWAVSLIVANTDCCPVGLICMMVEPVPCSLLLLLKLLTSTASRWRFPD
jgi:hypothetical protein